MKQHGISIAFFASMLAVGLPYWFIPYNTLNLPEAIIHSGLLVLSVSAFLLCSYGKPFWRVMIILSASVPAAVFVRVILDGVRDPTSHNLWPLEIIIALPVGVPAALAGAITGWLAARLKTKRGAARTG